MGQRGKGQGIAFLRAHLNDADGECVMWPLNRNAFGYGCVGYNGKIHKAHILMCEMVHGPKPSPKHHAAHSCGRGAAGCVHPKHIRWATPLENMADSVRLGVTRGNRGRRRAKLSPGEVARIRALAGTKPYTELAKMFDIRIEQVGKIVRGQQWRGTYTPLTDEQVRAIRTARGMQKDIARQLGISLNTVRNVLRGKGYRHVA